MVYTANWVIICYLPPIKGTRNNHWSETCPPYGGVRFAKISGWVTKQKTTPWEPKEVKSNHAWKMGLAKNILEPLKLIWSGQIIIFHQPRFPWNKGISPTKPPFGVRSCEVAIIWPDMVNVDIIKKHLHGFETRLVDNVPVSCWSCWSWSWQG